MVRTEDVSGLSGTGVVAEGCEFTSGYCALTWLSPLGTYTWYPSAKALIEVHGHGGRTKIIWLDAEPGLG